LEVYRQVLGHLAGGVAVVTSLDEAGAPCGFTATAVCSVSLEPPLVLVCAGSEGRATYHAIEGSGVFAVNLLGEGAAGLADRFAAKTTGKFAGVRAGTGVTGVPLLEDAMAHCECTVVRAVPAGDHTIFIGRVEAAAVREKPRAGPLVRFLGRYARLEPDSLGAPGD